LREQLGARLRDCGLQMHPGKTRVVYCKDRKRTGTYEHVTFDFIGYTFRCLYSFGIGCHGGSVDPQANS
ncbi:MAG: hypothetical protein WBN68_09115, partial [Sedimenticolaceae bacterium]